jgi:Ca2+-binding RTX toxin-like protein
MAIFDFNRLAYGVNEDDIVARVLTYGPIKQFNTSGGTSTSFKMDPPGRIAVKYEGEGFKYNAKGDPKQGTIESIQVTSKGHPEETFKITELKVDIAALKASGGLTLLSIFDGKDTFIGSRKDDKLSGFKGKDTMNGSDGHDSLDGGAGNDVLNGGRHSDTLTGGVGKDTFIFDTAIKAGDNVDVITDFVAADDTIKLDAGIFTNLGPAGVLDASHLVFGPSTTSTPGNNIIYDQTTGDLYFDKGNKAILFAHLDGMPTITHEDFVIV